MLATLLKEHAFCFNEDDNGGESLMLYTKMHTDGEEIYYEQQLSLASYGNSAVFNLVGVSLTPDILRKLADELEEVEVEAKKLI